MTSGRFRAGFRAAFAALAVLALLVMPTGQQERRRTACQLAVASPGDQTARARCVRAAEGPGAESELALLGHLSLLRGEMDAAEAIAQRLVEGPRAADGHRLLCEVLTRSERGQLGYDHGRIARNADAAHSHKRDLMRDTLCMSRAAWQSGNLGAALEAADETVRIAVEAADRVIEVQGHIAAADALRRIGAQTDARLALERAISRSSTTCELAWSYLKAGMLRAEAEEVGLARLDLDHAAHANESCASAAIAESLALNQAALRVRDDPAEASRVLDLHAAMYGDDDLVEVPFLRGLIAGNRGDDATASRLLDAAASREPPDADWPWAIERARAELAASRGTPEGEREAETHYRRSMAMVATLRSTTPAHSAFVLASHRAPYDGLIAQLARQGRWRDALAVLLELDAGDMLQAATSATRAAVAVGPPPSVDAVIEAWRERDLVIVLAPTSRLIGAGPDPVVRLHLTYGKLSGALIGSAAAAREDASSLFGTPDDASAARRLGDLVIPEAGRADSRADSLHVLLVGRLGKVPLAALRDRTGALVFEHRPLERVLSLRPRPTAGPTTNRAVVIADPVRNLPSARAEGKLVAEQVGPDVILAGPDGAAAVRARLEDARHARLLHVAAHVVISGRWRVLQLADHDVSPADMVALGLAPRLAVLASCGSGAAHDEEGWGSIAAALLSSGTAAVVATDRSVGDIAASRIVTAFYAQPDWSTDPARALARVQAGLARRGVPAAKWAPFTVFRGPPAVGPIDGAVQGR